MKEHMDRSHTNFEQVTQETFDEDPAKWSEEEAIGEGFGKMTCRDPAEYSTGMYRQYGVKIPDPEEMEDND